MEGQATQGLPPPPSSFDYQTLLLCLLINVGLHFLAKVLLLPLLPSPTRNSTHKSSSEDDKGSTIKGNPALENDFCTRLPSTVHACFTAVGCLYYVLTETMVLDPRLTAPAAHKIDLVWLYSLSYTIYDLLNMCSFLSYYGLAMCLHHVVLCPSSLWSPSLSSSSSSSSSFPFPFSSFFFLSSFSFLCTCPSLCLSHFPSFHPFPSLYCDLLSFFLILTFWITF